jgi:hypothetical protein
MGTESWIKLTIGNSHTREDGIKKENVTLIKELPTTRVNEQVTKAPCLLSVPESGLRRNCIELKISFPTESKTLLSVLSFYFLLSAVFY